MANQRPQISLTVTPNPAKVGQRVVVDITKSIDPEGKLKSMDLEIKREEIQQVAMEFPLAGTIEILGRVRDTGGLTAQATVPLVIEEEAVILPPKIVEQSPNVIIQAGQTTDLWVTLEGTEPMVKQWYEGKGTSWIPITGANDVVHSVQPGASTKYLFTAANEAGSVESAEFVVTVIAVELQPPVITQQPTSQTVQPGQSATFTVVATGDQPMTFQWKKDGTDVGTPTTGATSSQHTAPSTEEGAYVCVISNPVGQVTSETAILTVMEAGVAPVITQHPQSTQVGFGLSAVLSVVATGSDPKQYIWFRGNDVIVGAQGPSYITPGMTVDAVFRVLVKNALGEAMSNAATVTVQAVELPTSVLGPPHYKRSFRLPVDPNALDSTAFSYGGVAGREVNGKVKLYITSSEAGDESQRGMIIEVEDPGGSPMNPADYASSPIAPVRFYGNQWRAKRGTWRTLQQLEARIEGLKQLQDERFGTVLARARAERRRVELPPPNLWTGHGDLRPVIAAAEAQYGQWKSRKNVAAAEYGWDTFQNTPAADGGFEFTPDNRFMVVPYVDVYDVGSSQRAAFVLVEFNADGSTTGYGPFVTSGIDGHNEVAYGPRVSSMLCRNPFTGLMVTGSTLMSGNRASTWGPCYFTGQPWPTPSSPVGPEEVINLHQKGLYYNYMGWDQGIGAQIDMNGVLMPGVPLRSMKRTVSPGPFERPHPDDPGQNVLNIDPAVYGYGSWRDVEFAGGQRIVRIGNKAVMLVVSNALDGHGWYATVWNNWTCNHGIQVLGITGPVATSTYPSLLGFDVADIQKVLNGQIQPWQVEPVYQVNLFDHAPGIRFAPQENVGGARAHGLGYFHEPTLELYTVAQRADDSRWGHYSGAMFHVWGWD